MEGLVAAGSTHAASAGRAALERGGNAVDAAVVAMITAFVAEPCLTSPGGAGIAVIRDPASGEAETFDFFTRVPGLPASRIEADELDFARLEVDFGSDTTQVFHVGRGATAVPGNLPGLLALHRLHGRLPLAKLLEEPERRAREGYAISVAQAEFIRILQPILTYTPGIQAFFTPHDRPARGGDVLPNPTWAGVLAWIREHGEDPLTRGFLRDHLLEEWGAPAGLLSAEDLDAFEPRVGPSRRVGYRGHTVLLPGEPSVGGAMVGFMIRLLETVEPPPSPHAAAHYRMLGAALEVATAARRDADRGEGPPASDAWLADDFLDRWRERFEELRRQGGEGGRGDPGLVPGNTTHVSAVDAEGRAVAITTSNGESCGVVLPGLGLGMNNFLGEDDINQRGFHLDPPGTRLPTMMCPTLVRTREGRLLALGTGGSNRIRSAVLEVLVNVLDHGMVPTAAVEHPRLHRELDGAYLEVFDLDEACVDAMRAHFPGLKAFRERNLFFGGVHLASWSPEGVAEGAGDPRRDGHIAGTDR